MTHPEFDVHPTWRQTRNAHFPVAALVAGQWWVLRINAFPDHPLWTLFIAGQRRFDLDDTPPTWEIPTLALSTGLPRELLDDATAQAALATVAGFEAYGAEVGRPCDNMFCCG